MTLTAIFFYTVFSGFVVWRRSNMCCDGALALLAGACITIIPAAIYDYHQLPSGPDWRIECIKNGGSLVTKTVEYSGSMHPVENCERK